MNAVHVVALILYAAGFYFNLTGIIGILRLPDVYCRLHSTANNSTLGCLLIIAGLALREFQVGAIPPAVKLLLIAAILVGVAPVGSAALARAAYVAQVPLAKETVRDDYAGRLEGTEEKGDSDDGAV